MRFSITSNISCYSRLGWSFQAWSQLCICFHGSHLVHLCFEVWRVIRTHAGTHPILTLLSTIIYVTCRQDNRFFVIWSYLITKSLNKSNMEQWFCDIYSLRLNVKHSRKLFSKRLRHIPPQLVTLVAFSFWKTSWSKSTSDFLDLPLKKSFTVLKKTQYRAAWTLLSCCLSETLASS